MDPKSIYHTVRIHTVCIQYGRMGITACVCVASVLVGFGVWDWRVTPANFWLMLASGFFWLRCLGMACDSCKFLVWGLQCLVASLPEGLLSGSASKVFWGFGASPSRRHGSPFARARSPLVPSCIAPCVCATAPGGRPSGRPGDEGPEGHPPFVVRVFRACIQPGNGPVLRPSRHVPQQTMPKSGRAPGPLAGPGCVLVTAEKICVFPSFGTPKEFLIRGILLTRLIAKVGKPRKTILM